jgi:hypothetical protein
MHFHFQTYELILNLQVDYINICVSTPPPPNFWKIMSLSIEFC